MRKEFNVRSTIENVTVYRRGARVTRTAFIDAGPEGFPEEISLGGLPLSLDDGSLRVSVEAAGEGPAPVAREVRVGLDAGFKDKALPLPRDEELDAARLEEARLSGEVERLEQEMEALGGIELLDRPVLKRGEAPGPSPAGARLALLDFRTGRIKAAASGLAAARRLCEEAGQRLAELEFRKRAASDAQSPREHELRKSAVVTLESGGRRAARIKIEAQYVVPGASWAPSYSVAFDRSFSKTSLAVRAAVRQRSGEDWSGVKLALSTAEPMSWSELPKLPSLRIGRARPEPPAKGWREPPSGLETLFADYDAWASRMPPLSRPSPPPAPPEAPEPRKKKRRSAQPELADSFVPCVSEAAGDAFAFTGAEPEEADDSFAAPAEEACKEMAPAPKKKAMPPPAPSRAASRASMAPPAPMPSQAAPGGIPKGAAGSAFGGKREASALVAAREDLLDFANLRLAGAYGRGRGKLRPLGNSERYQEMLASMGMEAPPGVGDWVNAAFRRAHELADDPVPKDHQPPGPYDGFDFSWPCSAPADVPSDGAWHSIAVGAFDAPCSMVFVTAPRESPEAFRVASITNPMKAPLLPGPADVAIGGDFLMTVPLGLVPPGGKIELGLGVEEGIRTARNTRFREESGGLLGGRLSLEHNISIEVANNLKRPAEIEVRERVPVTREGDQEVEVAVGESKPPWHEFTQTGFSVRGTYRWRLTVQPGEKAALEAGYVVRISSKKELAGGNRREF